MQQEELVIHSMHAILTQQLKNLLIWFMKPNVVSTNMEALSSINLSMENQVSDEKLFIGSAARAYIAEHKTLTHINKFYDSVRDFFVAYCKYICAKFPFKDELLVRARILNVEMCQESDFQDVLYFVNHFTCLLGPGSEVRDQLEGQFLNYQTDNTIVVTKNERIDKIWSNIAQMKDMVGYSMTSLAKSCLALQPFFILMQSVNGCSVM